MKAALYLSIVITSLFLQACPHGDEPDMSYAIINNHSERIYLFQNNIDSIITSKYSTQRPIMFINSKDIFETPYNTSLFNKNRKLNILIYKESTLNKYSWQEIQEKNIFDKRYVLTLDELKAMNYKVVYDGK